MGNVNTYNPVKTNFPFPLQLSPSFNVILLPPTGYSLRDHPFNMLSGIWIPGYQDNRLSLRRRCLTRCRHFRPASVIKVLFI